MLASSVASLSRRWRPARALFTARPDFTPGGWLAVAFIGFSSGGGYYLWLWALSHAPADAGHRLPGAEPRRRRPRSGVWLLGEPVSLPAVLGLVSVGAGSGAPAHDAGARHAGALA